MTSLAIITARGGSKRIPGKNKKEFCGQPILWYSVRAALQSGAFDEVMVSTDDDDIAALAIETGAAVPFRRSAATANDYASTDAVIAEVLQCYEQQDRHFDRFCCIYPTAPFLTPDRLRSAMELLNTHESVTPVCAFSYPPQRGFIIKDGRLLRAQPEHAATRSQDLEKLYHDAGQFYACRTEAFLWDATTDVEDMVPLILDEDEVQDIDTFEDWRLAEQKFRRLQNAKRSLHAPVFDDAALATPYYRVDEAALDADIALLKGALAKNWPNHICSYSVKTNSLPWLLAHFCKAGFSAEVVSKEEYELAMRLGFARDKVIYNGPIKDKETFLRVLCDGAPLNLDSHQEPVWLREICSAHADRSFSVGLRVNCDLAALLPEEVLADEEGSRFGYCYENGELAAVIRELQSLPNLHIAGLHLHSSTKSRSPRAYATLARMACRIAEEFSLSLDYVDMGGGYYGGLPDKPDFNDYIPAIAEELRRGFDSQRTALIVEPGVSMVSSSFSFVTSVLDTKDIRGQRYVVTDGSRLNLNPQVTRRSYPHRLEYAQEERPSLPTQMICGSSCMEYDRLFPLENARELQGGDRIVYTNAGGYTICLTPLFIRYFPAVYVKKTDGSLYTARRPWTNDDFLAGNAWEES